MIKNLILFRITVVLIQLSFFSSCNEEQIDAQKETAPEITYEIYEVYNTYKDDKAPFLNMRSEANSDSKIVAKLYDGTQLHMLDKNSGENGNWCKVAVVETKEKGFVHGHWIRKLLTGDDRYQYYDSKILTLTDVYCYEGNECTFEFTDNRKRYQFDWYLEAMNAEEGSFEKRFMDTYGTGYGDDPYKNLIGKKFRVYYQKGSKIGECEDRYSKELDEYYRSCVGIIDVVLTEDIEITEAKKLYHSKDRQETDIAAKDLLLYQNNCDKQKVEKYETGEIKEIECILFFPYGKEITVESRAYYKNGQLAGLRGHYTDSTKSLLVFERVGEVYKSEKVYDENGKLIKEYNWRGGWKKNGKINLEKHGRQFQTYKGGEKQMEHLIKDKKHWVKRYWQQNGQLTKEEYENGEEIYWQKDYFDGDDVDNTVFRHRGRDGQNTYWRDYYPSGQLKYEENGLIETGSPKAEIINKKCFNEQGVEIDCNKF